MFVETVYHLSQAAYIEGTFALHACWEPHNNPQWYGIEAMTLEQETPWMSRELESFEWPIDSAMFDIRIVESRESPYLM